MFDYVQYCYSDFEKLVVNFGLVIVGVFQGVSCFGLVYEYVFILDKVLCDVKICYKVLIIYVISEFYIGYLGLGGVGDFKFMLELELCNCNIKWICNVQVDKVIDGVMYISELNCKGEVDFIYEEVFRYFMLILFFGGVFVVVNVEGLCNFKGFVIMDEYQCLLKYFNIFLGGVCVVILLVEIMLVFIGMLKIGYMIEIMMMVIVYNLKCIIVDNQVFIVKGIWYVICFVDMGDIGVVFVVMLQILLCNVIWFK